jgi:ubiquitin C-terminal hydrolase
LQDALLRGVDVADDLLIASIGSLAPGFAEGDDGGDIAQCLTSILDRLDRDLTIGPPKPFSALVESDLAAASWFSQIGESDAIIVDLFCGQTSQSIHCAECIPEPTVFLAFNVYPVCLPPHEDGEIFALVRLITCTLTGAEELDDPDGGPDVPPENAPPLCRVCGERYGVISRAFSRLPPVLVLQLGRFSNDREFLRKRRTRVVFPDELDMSPWTEGWPNPGTYMHHLHSVIVHIGPLGETSHYISYIRVAGSWFQFDDDEVTKVTDATVHSAQAYILLYVGSGSTA